ncbi:EthD family reductase [Actinokineospora sp.]|uniref:EthD family reductase n=1 Tax=Actinokineospora sp. TaxID=1872133 RepID=UPI004037AF0F
MIKYIALYRRPADADEFDEKYFGSHLPLAVRTPGLVRQEIARVQRTFVPGFLGDSEPYLIAELYFESAAAMKEAFKSPEWQASGANLTEIGGMDLVAMFSAEVVENP